MHETDFSAPEPSMLPISTASDPPAKDVDLGPGPLAQLPQDANWQAIADYLHQRNCRLESQLAPLQQSLQAAQRDLDIERVRSRSIAELEAAARQEARKAAALDTALRACQTLNQEQLRTIATLSERLAISQARASQLERECVALQATCREQAERTACAQQEIQALQERLQRQRLQAQADLEGHPSEAPTGRSNAWPPPIISDTGAHGTAETLVAAEAPRVPTASTSGNYDGDFWEEDGDDGDTVALDYIGSSAIELPVASSLTSATPPRAARKRRTPVAIDLPQF